MCGTKILAEWHRKIWFEALGDHSQRVAAVLSFRRTQEPRRRLGESRGPYLKLCPGLDRESWMPDQVRHDEIGLMPRTWLREFKFNG